MRDACRFDDVGAGRCLEELVPDLYADASRDDVEALILFGVSVGWHELVCARMPS